MGKREKKQKHQRNHHRGAFNYCQDEEDGSSPYQLTQPYSSSSSPPRVSLSDEEKEHEEEEDDDNDDNNGEKEAVNEETSSDDMPSKFLLYQQSVQSPKGDISYMQKFFLMYVGGRMPLHLQEDFCGTALISMCGSKLILILLRGKQGSASIFISRSNRERFAMHFPTAGGCGHCLRSGTA